MYVCVHVCNVPSTMNQKHIFVEMNIFEHAHFCAFIFTKEKNDNIQHTHTYNILIYIYPTYTVNHGHGKYNKK